MIVKVNQEMLDNDANLQDANEDIVDENIPKTKDHPNQEMTQTEPSNGKGEIETTEDEKAENSDSEDLNLDGTDSSLSEIEDVNYDNLNVDQLLKILDKKVSSGKVQYHKREVEALSKQIEPKLIQIFEEKKNNFISSGGEPEGFEPKITEKKTYDDLIRRYKFEKG